MVLHIVCVPCLCLTLTRRANYQRKGVDEFWKMEVKGKEESPRSLVVFYDEFNIPFLLAASVLS